MSEKNITSTIKDIQTKFLAEIKDLDIDTLYVKYLGKKGEINRIFKEISVLSRETRIKASKEINILKSQIEKEIEIRKEKSKDEFQIISDKNIDLTIPVKQTQIGNLHPLTIVLRDLYQFFHYYGFSVYDGPEIEDDFHNFEMLGVPINHPARDMQDTFYILEPEFLLRTQTSSIEARQLIAQNPPIRFVYGGKVYRNETSNKSNASFFNQFQGVYVDKDVSMGHLKWIFTKALKHILGEDTIIRFRAKYYPEVEPGLSPDIMCSFCKGEGCEVCKGRGWIEIAGGGMIHPSTLEKAKIDSSEYSGFAFGWGLDRIAMAKFNIRDIRLLYNGSIVYE